MTPDDLRYTEDHEWARETADGVVRVGITDHAQRQLGDVVLCPAFAAAQARKAGHGLGDELALLTVHGVLHLLGYDHAEPDQEREMFGLQNALLAEWQSARHEAATREAQRRHDSRLLGTVGLDDS